MADGSKQKSIAITERCGHWRPFGWASRGAQSERTQSRSLCFDGTVIGLKVGYFPHAYTVSTIHIDGL